MSGRCKIHGTAHWDEDVCEACIDEGRFPHDDDQPDVPEFTLDDFLTKAVNDVIEGR